MTRTVYQLHAHGPYRHMSGIGEIVSRKVFSNRDAAEAEIASFVKRCCDSGDGPRSLHDLDPDEIKTRITELELVE